MSTASFGCKCRAGLVGWFEVPFHVHEARHAFPSTRPSRGAGSIFQLAQGPGASSRCSSFQGSLCLQEAQSRYTRVYFPPGRSRTEKTIFGISFTVQPAASMDFLTAAPAPASPGSPERMEAVLFIGGGGGGRWCSPYCRGYCFGVCIRSLSGTNTSFA